LTSAGLLLRSFARIVAVDPGFDAAPVQTFRMSAQWSERNAAVVQRQARTIARLTEIPGVEAAAFSQFLPASADIPPGAVSIIGRDDRERTFAASPTVGPRHFPTLALPVLRCPTRSNDPAAP